MHVIIYCRLNSKRFKNKGILKLINRKLLIEQIISQAKKISSEKKIILATTKKKEDSILCNIAKKNNINYYRGSENNVALRTYNVCKIFKVNYFYRYCADRPFLNINAINKIKKKLKNNNFDILTTTNKQRSIDKGLTIEILNAKMFMKVYKTNDFSKNEKEHILNFFYNNHKNFKIKNIILSKKFYQKFNYTIDYKTDLFFINYILKNIKLVNKNFLNIAKLYKVYYGIN